MAEPQQPDGEPLVEEPVLPPIEFTAAGSSEEVRLALLESVTPSPGYAPMCFVLADALTKGSSQVVFDFSAEAVVVRFKIDGMWHQMPTVDRQTGDYMLASIKRLADLNYRERRARQEGQFDIKFAKVEYVAAIVCQGTQTGERCLISFREHAATEKTPEELGMRPKMRDQLVSLMNQSSGMVVITALPGDGMTTNWSSMLLASDRFMRDVVTIQEESRAEPDLINVRLATFSEAKNQTALSGLEQILLREPDVLAFTEIPNARYLDRFCELATEDEKMVFTRIHAKHAVDGLIRLLAMKSDSAKLASALSGIVYGRLARKLCEKCKMGFIPAPQLLAQLNIPPGRVTTLYTHFTPRPEDLVDEQGQPIQLMPCDACGGLGYRGQIGFFELLVINDELRQAIKSRARAEQIAQLAKKAGHVSLRDEGIVQVAKGLTSVEELQRVLSK